MRDLFRDLDPSLLWTECNVDEYQNLSNLLHSRSLFPGVVFASFVKCPVSILIHLPFPDTIDCVVLKTSCGRHRVRNLSLHITKFNTKLTDNQSRHQIIEHLQSTRPVATVSIPEEEDVVVIHFTSKVSEENLRRESKHLSPHSKLLSLPANNRVLISVKHLLIRITRMYNSSLPCLGGVELWNKDGAVHPVESSPSGKRHHEEDEESNSPSSSLPDDIPEAFLDPITCEVMTNPLLLPSGNYVDRKTLDRYWKTSLKPFSSPLDPFTLKKIDKPQELLVDVYLKSRIEAYIRERKTNILGTKSKTQKLGAAAPFIYNSVPPPPANSSFSAAQSSTEVNEDDLDLSVANIIHKFPWISSSTGSSTSASCDLCSLVLDPHCRGAATYRVRGCGSTLCAACSHRILERRCPGCGLVHIRRQVERVFDSGLTPQITPAPT